jgi:hypothetical protein
MQVSAFGSLDWFNSLEATLGGYAADFRIVQIAYWVFKFVVALRNVDFHIYNLRSFSCDQYKIFSTFGEEVEPIGVLNFTIMNKKNMIVGLLLGVGFPLINLMQRWLEDPEFLRVPIVSLYVSTSFINVPLFPTSIVKIALLST